MDCKRDISSQVTGVINIGPSSRRAMDFLCLALTPKFRKDDNLGDGMKTMNYRVDFHEWISIVTRLFHFIQLPHLLFPSAVFDGCKILCDGVRCVIRGEQFDCDSLPTFPDVLGCLLAPQSIQWLRQIWDGLLRFIQNNGVVSTKKDLSSSLIAFGLLRLHLSLPVSSLDPKAKYSTRRKWGEKQIEGMRIELKGREMMSEYLIGSPDSVMERRREELFVLSKSLEKLKWKETPRDVYSPHPSEALSSPNLDESTFGRLLDEMHRLTSNLFSEERISSLISQITRGDFDAEVNIIYIYPRKILRY